MGILLPAPIHEDEDASFGVSAPTSSTTVALSLGDALAIATARKLHTAPGKGPAEVFRGFHPGGAIGAAAAGTPLTTPSSGMSTTFDSPASSVSLSLPWEEIGSIPLIPPFNLQSPPAQRRISPDMLISLDQIPTASSPSSSSPGDVRLLDILLTAIQHPNAKSWVFLSPHEIIPPRQTRSLLSPGGNMDMRVSEVMTENPNTSFAIHRSRWLLVPDSIPLADLRHKVSASRNGPHPISVVAVVKDMNYPDSCIGVMEAEDLLDA
jgi:hypothetical protein